MMPAVTIDSELIAPSISPICIAREVPIACEAVPIATPLAILFSILNIFSTASQMMFPSTPVSMMPATVIDT